MTTERDRALTVTVTVADERDRPRTAADCDLPGHFCDGWCEPDNSDGVAIEEKP